MPRADAAGLLTRFSARVQSPHRLHLGRVAPTVVYDLSAPDFSPQTTVHSPPPLCIVAGSANAYEPACCSGIREHEDGVSELPRASRSLTSSPQ
jgi:hypothetical protein